MQLQQMEKPKRLFETGTSLQKEIFLNISNSIKREITSEGLFSHIFLLQFFL